MKILIRFLFFSSQPTMFSLSTQRKHWMFDGEDAIREERDKAHNQFVQRYQQQEQQDKQFLDIDEANLLRAFYEKKLMEFCCRSVFIDLWEKLT